MHQRSTAPPQAPSRGHGASPPSLAVRAPLIAWNALVAKRRVGKPVIMTAVGLYRYWHASQSSELSLRGVARRGWPGLATHLSARLYSHALIPISSGCWLQLQQLLLEILRSEALSSGVCSSVRSSKVVKGSAPPLEPRLRSPRPITRSTANLVVAGSNTAGAVDFPSMPAAGLLFCDLKLLRCLSVLPPPLYCFNRDP